MGDRSGVGPWRRGLGSAALAAGGALAYLAGSAFLAWGMILGSGVDLGGTAGFRWLMNLSEAAVAVGVIAGGWLVDRRRLVHAAALGVACLGAGALVAWRAPGSAAAVLVGLGGAASLGCGALMALAVVVPAARAGVKLRGLLLGLVLGLGLLGIEEVWASASMLSLSRGAAWVLGHVAWLGPAAGAVGGALLILGDRLGALGDSGTERWRLPLVGPRPGETDPRSTQSPAFWILAALAFLTSFAGLASNRAGAALSLIGLPESSFASGVMVGYTFAMARAAGAAAGGVIHDVLGPRVTAALAGLGLAAAMVVLSRHTGYDNPWHPLIGSIGAACGLGLAVVPLAAVHVLGRCGLGVHFGFLYLAIALGDVAVIPLRGAIDRAPQAALLATAAAAVAVAIAAVWLRAPAARAVRETGEAE